jgi:hypothetical protein
MPPKSKAIEKEKKSNANVSFSELRQETLRFSRTTSGKWHVLEV